MRLIVAEKKDQAQKYAQVLGLSRQGRNWFDLVNGDIVTWVWGHAFRLVEPRDHKSPPNWQDRAAWPFIEKPRFVLSEDQKNRDQVKAIHQLVKRAKEVVWATDPDREGDLIWYTIYQDLVAARMARTIRHLRFLGGNDLNAGPIKAAFGRLEPLDGHMSKAMAGLARAVNDLRWGTSLTVGASVDLRPVDLKGVWKTGRVKAPALWLLEARERELEAFVERTYFEIEAEVQTDQGVLLMRFAPDEDERIHDRATADLIVREITGRTGVLAVDQRRSERQPPKLLTKTGLLVGAGRACKLSGESVEEAGQANYQIHQVQTYLRSSCPYISSADAENVREIASHLAAIPELAPAAKLVAANPVIRRGHIVSDREVQAASHTAIIPTLTPAERGRMSDVEWLVYLFVAKRYLAAMMPAGIDFVTSVGLTLAVGGYDRPVGLRIRGTVVVEPGWRQLLGGDGSDDDEEGGALPPVKDGAAGRILGARVLSKKTRPPARFTKLSWQDGMQNIDRLVDDPIAKRRLQASKGLGTESSRQAMALELIATGMVELLGKGHDPQLRVTPVGRLMMSGMETRYPNVLSPLRTANAEIELQRIAEARDVSSAQRLADAWLSREVEELTEAMAALRRGGPLSLPAGLTAPSVRAPATGSRKGGRSQHRGKSQRTSGSTRSGRAPRSRLTVG